MAKDQVEDELHARGFTKFSRNGSFVGWRAPDGTLVGDDPSQITKEWFAKKPAHVPGQMKLIAQEDLEPGDDVEIDLETGAVTKMPHDASVVDVTLTTEKLEMTKPESKPLTAAEIVARRLRGTK